MPPWSRWTVARFSRVLERAAQRHHAAAAAVVILRRPVVVLGAPAIDRRQGDRAVVDQRVGLQARAQRGEIAQRLDGRARLPEGLGRAVELAQRIGESAGHRQDAAGLVLERDHHSLHLGADPQLGPNGGLALALDQVNEHDVVEPELALGVGAIERERHHAAVGKADAPAVHPAAAAGLSHHDGGRPVHVVERQAGIGERLLPIGPLVGARAVRLELLDGRGQVRFGAVELEAAGVALVARQALLQRLLDRPLQGRIDGRMDAVGGVGHALEAGGRFRLAHHLIDEMKSDIAARPSRSRSWSAMPARGPNSSILKSAGSMPSSRIRVRT